jgi:hypothetical protein
MESPPNDDRGQGYPTGDYWVNGQWHIRRAIAGNSLIDLWITTKDAMMPSHDKRWLVPSPNGKSQVRFHLSNPWPPVDVVLHAYDTLGHGALAARDGLQLMLLRWSKKLSCLLTELTISLLKISSGTTSAITATTYGVRTDPPPIAVPPAAIRGASQSTIFEKQILKVPAWCAV